MTIEPQQAFAIWRLLPEPVRLLLLLTACTGVRVSEGFGLQWGDSDFSRSCIHIRRAWTGGRVGATKTKASKSAQLGACASEHYHPRWILDARAEER